MTFTVDQWIQIANAAGTWVAGIGTLAAVAVSLWLALDSRRVRLRLRVGVSQLLSSDGTTRTEFVNFEVTNLAERPVTITAVGWAIDKGKRRRRAHQDISNRRLLRSVAAAEFLANLPVQLNHGNKANIGTEFSHGATLALLVDFVGDSPLDTMHGIVTTSVGDEVEAKVSPVLIERIQRVQEARRASQQAGAA